MILQFHKWKSSLSYDADSSYFILGLTVDQIQNLLIDPGAFITELRDWASGKGIIIEETYLQVRCEIERQSTCLNVHFLICVFFFAQGIMFAKLNPENVSPTELLTMLTDPRTAICDPDLVSQVIEARNMTTDQVQESLRPLCNLSMENAMELLELTKQNVDWKQVQEELEEFSMENGNGPLSVKDWQQLIQVSEDIRRDLLEKGSIKKVIGYEKIKCVTIIFVQYFAKLKLAETKS